MANHRFTSLGPWKMPILAALILPSLLANYHLAAASNEGHDPALSDLIEADWAAQERRLQRTPDAPESVRGALQRGVLLVYPGL